MPILCINSPFEKLKTNFDFNIPVLMGNLALKNLRGQEEQGIDLQNRSDFHHKTSQVHLGLRIVGRGMKCVRCGSTCKVFPTL